MFKPSEQVTYAEVEEMVRLQDEMNSTVNSNWIELGRDWTLAAKLELAEAIEHRGWKWWKDLDAIVVDWPQVQLEIVDAWHFHISRVLVQQKGNRTATAGILFTQLTRNVELDEAVPSDFNTLASNYNEWLGRGVGWLDLILASNFTPTQLYSMYLTKNILNIFRQENGYKVKGKYIKMWFGAEDNVMVLAIKDSLLYNDNLSAATLHAGLTSKYADVLASESSKD